MKKRHVCLWILLLLFVLHLGSCTSEKKKQSCSDALGCVHFQAGETIKLGVLLPLSEEFKDPGRDQLRGLKLALEDKDWSIAGHSIQLVIEDSHCSKEGGITGALKLTAESGLVAVFGTYCSIAATQASKIISDKGMVMISAGNTAPSLTAVGGSPGEYHSKGYFRTSHNDQTMGRAVADFAKNKLALDRAATINDGDPYTSGLTKAFIQSFQDMGGEVVLQATVNKGDQDMGPVLKAVRQAGPNVLFFPIFRPAGDHLVKQARKNLNLESLALVTGAGLFDESFYESVGEAGRGLYFVVPAVPKSKEYKQFLTRFKSAYATSPKSGHFAHAYDAGGILLEALQEALIEGKDGSFSIGLQAVREALYSISDYPGVTGRLSCDRFGDCGKARFKIVRLDDPRAGFDSLASNVIFTYTHEK